MKKYYLVRLIIVFLFIPKIGLIAQNMEKTLGDYLDYNNIQMPNSPTPTAFDVMGEIEVNFAKGVPIIDIPLYTFMLDGVKVPISISYDTSGIKVNQRASSVGLGWTLHSGGSINRSIRGWPDENPGIWGWYQFGFLDDAYYSTKDPNDDFWQRTMKGIPSGDGSDGLANLVDHNPDLYNYSFLGYSGSFIHDTEINMIKEKKDGITIASLGNWDDDLWANDLHGNKYFFFYDDTEISNNVVSTFEGASNNIGSRNWDGELGFYPVTAWNLSQIITKNNKVINFEYENVDIKYTLDRFSSNITVGMDCNDDKSYIPPPIKKVNYTTTEYDIKSKQIKKISSPHSNIEISFKYIQDSGFPNSVQTSKLTEIIIADLESKTKKIFYLEYDRYQGDPRLKLTSIKEVAFKNGLIYEKPPYTFVYDQGSLPAKNSKSMDLYGYYNAALNGTKSVPWMDIGSSAYQGFFNQHSANRNLNVNTIKNGILNKMYYPTGGYTEFQYEPNVHNNKYYGGLRVSKIEDHSETGTYHSRIFEYDNPQGKPYGNNLNLFIKKQGEQSDLMSAMSYHSSPIRAPGDIIEGYKTGFFYGNVIVHSSVNNESFKTEYIYHDNLFNNQTYEPVQVMTRIMNSMNQTIKITEYHYEKVGDLENFIWNTLGDMICYYHPSRYRTIWPGYSTTPRKIQFSGNYAYLPTRIATTEFLKRGGTFEPITVLKDITYDPQTLLKKQEIIDTRYQRQENSPGNITYALYDANASYIITDYTYPFEVSDYNSLPTFPKGLVIKQETFNTKNGQTIQTAGKAFAFDDYGNIKTVYGFSQGQGSNNSSLSYVPGTYEELTSFIYSDGYPVQVKPKKGIPTSYIWNKKSNTLVAKIEGRPISGINSGLVSQLENATYGQLPSLLSQLRTSLLGQSHPPFVTTYTYKPLTGVATITDPKNQIITYEYDVFGRLESVKDLEGNLVEEYEYNYSNN